MYFLKDNELLTEGEKKEILRNIEEISSLITNNPVTTIQLSLHLFHSVIDRCNKQCGVISYSALKVGTMLDVMDASFNNLILCLFEVDLFLLRILVNKICIYIVRLCNT